MYYSLHSRRISRAEIHFADRPAPVRAGADLRRFRDRGRLVASVEIARLLFVAGKIPREEHDRVRHDLLNYCERDTWAMVKVLEKLRELAAVTQGR